MKASPILSDTLQYLRFGARRIIHQGGMSSGKTVNILIALATMAAEETYSVTTVTGMSFPQLKGGALRDFEMYVYPAFKSVITSYNKTNHVFTFTSGSIIEFKVFENEMAARGAKRKRLFINEANSFDYMVFFQLDSRSEQTIIDYNPTINFWAHELLIGFPGNYTFYSDHRHNPFLSEEKHKEIENICVFKRNEDGSVSTDLKGNPIVISGNFENWKVYARGLTGNVTGLIFPNWVKIDETDFLEDAEFTFGIDFGYTNDPTAIVKMYRQGEALYFKELSYSPGIPATEIKKLLLDNGYIPHIHPVYCDRDPDMIRQLNLIGVLANGARKGAGSVNAGIELLNQYRIYYTVTSTNITLERSKYMWEMSKETGKPTNIPVDAFNHLLDACRYAAYSRFIQNRL